MQSATAILTGNLPAEPNSFIGRERDLAELARLLGEVRALTLSGPGASTVLRFAVHVPMTERHAQWWALVKVMYYGRVRYTEAVPVVIGPVN